ncbi:putative alpha-1,3-mannosyltransferase DI49_4794 [Saccharomyces eubayanus]|uniref:putative alpha-1,3-mannosyltransferase n=1 Tax=Saccharomyces eubayanus TaxID=1080349 RepID=UPI0006C4537F|nr:hypothetical protein DI49_4794 [Saccharomyces eubayanus]KOG97211.1 hypothetical protein DI49_4794 [Saccharomyces eubayanus]
MGFRVRRTKKLVTLVLISSLFLVVLFRCSRNYLLLDNFRTQKENASSKTIQCLSELAQTGSSKRANEFYDPSIWKTFLSFINGGHGDVKTLTQSLFNIQLYQQCTKNTSIDHDVPLLHEVEGSLFPYMDFPTLHNGDIQDFWPIHSRFDGSTHRGQVLEFSTTDNSFIGTSRIEFNISKPFWENWLVSAVQNGSKGLVMSVSDYQVADSIRLIRVLRLLNNSLPIEIVHKSDLSENYQQLLIASARESESLDYPPQELWFLNVKSLLKDNYVAKFKRFSNKWLAITFCSFQIPILLDSDTVPFVSLDTFYEIDEFKRTGTLFFKDRGFPTSKLGSHQINVLKKVIDNCLGIPLDSKKDLDLLKNRLKDDMAMDAVESLVTKHQKHYMESGLLVLDKQKHFSSLLVSMMLQFSPIQEYFYGDKEWFWLGLLLSNDTFTFHPVEASNVGALKDLSTPDSAQMCSIQLSHTDIHGNVLWLNGGLSVCKKACWVYDYTKRKDIASRFESVDELQKHYRSPVKLENVIIPEVNKSPWSQNTECAGYNYCTKYKKGEYGTLIEFTEHQKKSYERIVQLWNDVI